MFAPILAALSLGYMALRSGRRGLAFTQLLVTAFLAVSAVIVWYGNLWVKMAVTPSYLYVALVTILATCGVALWAAVVEWRDRERSTTESTIRWGARLATGAAVLMTMAPAAAAVFVIEPEIQVARRSFVSAPVAQPHELDSSPTVDPTTVAGSPTTVPSDTVSPSTLDSIFNGAIDPSAGGEHRLNVLLLGGDAGGGRWSLRTDSMNLVSIDTITGDAAIIGIPRNLMRAPMPPGPLKKAFPRGFDNLMNAMYVWGDQHPDAVRAALGATDVPGASLVTASAAELLGVRVDAWILVDMLGFINVIDALGGLDVYVPKRITMPGNVVGADPNYPDFLNPGWHHLNGTISLGFSRMRHDDSDYNRMARQRCLLASIAAQKSKTTIASHWPALSKVIADRIRTNLSTGQLQTLLRLAGLGVNGVRTVALTPPLVPEAGWNARLVRQIVKDSITNTGKYAPKNAGSTTTVLTTLASVTTYAGSADPGSTTSSTLPSTVAPGPPVTAPVSGSATVGEACRTRP
jgi:LCP family protein required for cell wall assembly